MKPATMRYFDAIHAQLDAIDVWNSDTGDRIAAEVKRVRLEMEGMSPSLADIKKMSVHLLERAEPYFLDGVIQEWIMDSLDSFPSDICMGDVLPPSRMGWMLFKRPISAFRDKDPVLYGTTELHNWTALAWSTVDRMVGQEGNREFPVVALDYYHRTDTGYLVLGSSQTWPFHERLHWWKEATPQPDRTMQHTFVISLFAFMNQPFSTVESHRLPRSSRRRLQRETGIEDPMINVISLRRAQHTNGQSKGGTREWSSRWLVKGHWRSQYYPSKQKNSPLWIMPYVKGPQDKPLKSRNGIALFHVTR